MATARAWPAFQVVVTAPDNDFNGDGKSDYAIFRPVDNDWAPLGLSRWYALINRSDKGAELYDWARQWGLDGDIPVFGDYNGDGKTDYTVFRPRDFFADPTGPSNWYIALNQGSGNNIKFAKWSYSFGLPDDIPVPGDYDGDGTADLALYRPSTGMFYTMVDVLSDPGPYTRSGTLLDYGLPIWNPAGQPAATGGTPISGDFNGDGRADYAVYQTVNGEGLWRIRLNLPDGTRPYTLQAFGQTGDIPLSGDFDGDGKADFAVYRPQDTDLTAQGYGWVSAWRAALNQQLIVSATPPATRPANQVQLMPKRLHGLATDIPVTADYNGDGRTDFTVYRPNDRTVPGFSGYVSAWYTILNLGPNSAVVWDWARGHGRPTDIPIGRNPLPSRQATTSSVGLASTSETSAVSTTAASGVSQSITVPKTTTFARRRILQRAWLPIEPITVATTRFELFQLIRKRKARFG